MLQKIYGYSDIDEVGRMFESCKTITNLLNDKVYKFSFWGFIKSACALPLIVLEGINEDKEVIFAAILAGVVITAVLKLARCCGDFLGLGHNNYAVATVLFLSIIILFLAMKLRKIWKLRKLAGNKFTKAKYDIYVAIKNYNLAVDKIQFINSFGTMAQKTTALELEHRMSYLKEAIEKQIPVIKGLELLHDKAKNLQMTGTLRESAYLPDFALMNNEIETLNSELENLTAALDLDAALRSR